MNARDIMTTPVVTVSADTPISEIAALLFEKRISAVPVLEEGRLVGLVGEVDLLHRYEIGTDRKAAGSWWLRLLGRDPSPGEYVKSHARHARDVMRHDVPTVSPETPVAELADLFATRGIRRFAVLRDGELVGIVSRADIVRALARMADGDARPEQPSDAAIRARLLAELERQPWWRPTESRVDVEGGVVQFWGLYKDEAERDAARVAAENIAGVRAVRDRRHSLQSLPSMV